MIPVSSRRPKLIALLEAISDGRGDLPLEGFDAGTVAWAIQGGLGPFFYRAVKERPDNAASAHWPVLKAADLTARVLMGDYLDAMAEIVDACQTKVPSLTLVKGISIAEECYPEPHLRLMRDLDFLVEKESVPAVKDALERLGYAQPCGSTTAYETHHHVAPFFHPAKNVWIEVHHGLFSPQRMASRTGVFQTQTLLAQSRRSQFQGREVRRFSLELQLVYLASHWAQDLPALGGLVALVDTICLLRQAGGGLRWAWILDSVRGSIAGSSLHLLLSYLVRHGLLEIAPETLRELFVSQPSFGVYGLKVAHGIVDRYCVEGKPLGRLSNKGLTLLWEALILPRPTFGRSLRAPLAHSLPHRRRAQ